MATDDTQPTQPIGHTPADREPQEDTMSDQESPTRPDTPADRTAPHVSPTATTTATAASAAPLRRSVRIGTVVWGLVIAAIGLGILAFALGLVFDVELAMIVVVAAAGVLLLVGSLATSRRRR
jgi:hypothetical protein